MAKATPATISRAGSGLPASTLRQIQFADALKLNINSEHGDIAIHFIDVVVDVYDKQAKDGALRNTAFNRYLHRLSVSDVNSLRATDQQASNPPQEITPNVCSA